MRSSTCLSLVTAVLLMTSTAAANPRVEKVDKIGRAPRAERAMQIQAPPNDQCSGSILLPCGNINIASTTNGATHDYGTDSLHCTGFKAQGLDVVYKVDVGPGDSLWVDYRNTADGSIYLVSDCGDPVNTCAAGSDETVAPNEIESLRYGFVVGGIYYLILDSFGVGSSGDFTLVGQLICGPNSPPQNDLCEAAITLPCGPFDLTGSNQYAHDDYTLIEGGGCTGHAANGNDVVYRLNVTAGDSVWVNYFNTADGSVYIVGDCNDEVGTCIAGADVNGPSTVETLRHKFNFTGTYYMVFDSRASGWGFWSANGGLVCLTPPPPNDLCSGAIALGYGPINLSGSTRLAANDYYFANSTLSCTEYETFGKDVVYKFTVNPGDQLTLEYNSSTDAAVYIATDCADLPNTCVAGKDLGTTGETEYLDYIFLSTGTHYLILDSVELESWGNWTAVGALTCCVTGVESGPDPSRLAFRNVLPNPFGRSTAISFQMPAEAHASLRIFDLQGRLARTLLDRTLVAGEHRMVWDGTDDQGMKVLPGVYFAHLASEGRVTVRRMIFVR